MATDRGGWAPDWSASYSYGLREVQAQTRMDEPGPGSHIGGPKLHLITQVYLVLIHSDFHRLIR